MKVPTLVMMGGERPPWAAQMAEVLVAALPDGRRTEFKGQTHDVAIDVLAAALREFLASAESTKRTST